MAGRGKQVFATVRVPGAGAQFEPRNANEGFHAGRLGLRRAEGGPEIDKRIEPPRRQDAKEDPKNLAPWRLGGFHRPRIIPRARGMVEFGKQGVQDKTQTHQSRAKPVIRHPREDVNIMCQSRQD